jgi:hypothetical protein
MKQHPRKGFIDTIEVDIWVNYDGVNYALNSHSIRRIKERYPEARPLPNIFLGYEDEKDFPARHAPLWERMIAMLTDLTPEQMAELGGICMYQPRTKKVIWRWEPARQRSTA